MRSTNHTCGCQLFRRFKTACRIATTGRSVYQHHKKLITNTPTDFRGLAVDSCRWLQFSVSNVGRSTVSYGLYHTECLGFCPALLCSKAWAPSTEVEATCSGLVAMTRQTMRCSTQPGKTARTCCLIRSSPRGFLDEYINNLEVP